MSSADIVTYIASNCNCVECTKHRDKTTNCQCNSCISHRNITKQPIMGKTEVIVNEKVEKNNNTIGWIIFGFIVLFIIIIIVGICSRGNYGYSSKETVTETIGTNGTKTYTVYKTNNDGDGWAWIIFWVFIFFLILSPTYYVV